MSFKSTAFPLERSIPLCAPEIRGNEWAYIKECLDTNWVSSGGPFVERFENLIADYIGAKYAVATVNGTAALHIALLVSSITANDEVLIPSLTFIAPANAVRYIGAWPVFMDAEPQYWQMDPQKTLDFIKRECFWINGELRNKTSKRRIKAMLPVHILGHPIDMEPLLEVAQKYGLVVIEDATESLGAKYKNSMVGHTGDIACLSFNGNKIITTGGGGMIVTDNEAWAVRARYLTTQAKDDPLEFVHGEVGYNYRLTNLQAAMGCAQLEEIDSYIDAKRHTSAIYTETLSSILGLTPIVEAPWAFSTFWLYTVLVEEKRYGINSRELLRKLRDAHIESRPLWQPLHLSPAHRGCQSYYCDVAEKLNRDALSLPSSVGLSASDQELVLDIVSNVNSFYTANGYA